MPFWPEMQKQKRIFIFVTRENTGIFRPSGVQYFSYQKKALFATFEYQKRLFMYSKELYISIIAHKMQIQKTRNSRLVQKRKNFRKCVVINAEISMIKFSKKQNILWFNFFCSLFILLGAIHILRSTEKTTF